MMIWVARVGADGQHETDFLDNSHIGVGYGFKTDLTSFSSRKEIQENHPSDSNANTLWRFYQEVQEGDLVVVPFKSQPILHIGKITGKYLFRESKDPYHTRSVEWLANDIPRTELDSELLPSLNGHAGLYGIRRDDAPRRVEALINRWKHGQGPALVEDRGEPESDESDSEDDTPDMEKLGLDLIARSIITKFKGHGLAKLAGALLEAQGYTVHVSPPGPDGGIDIRAAGGALGLGAPRICVQVKSGATPAGSPEIHQLMGSMANAGAEHGVFLSWSGFKQGVEREWSKQYFKIRFWDQRSFVDELLDHYEKLDSDIRAELPLKQIWTTVQPE